MTKKRNRKQSKHTNNSGGSPSKKKKTPFGNSTKSPQHNASSFQPIVVFTASPKVPSKGTSHTVPSTPLYGRSALPVADINEDDLLENGTKSVEQILLEWKNTPVTSPEEYLFRVRFEARHTKNLYHEPSSSSRTSTNKKNASPSHKSNNIDKHTKNDNTRKTNKTNSSSGSNVYSVGGFMARNSDLSTCVGDLLDEDDVWQRWKEGCLDRFIVTRNQINDTIVKLHNENQSSIVDTKQFQRMKQIVNVLPGRRDWKKWYNVLMKKDLPEEFKVRQCIHKPSVEVLSKIDYVTRHALFEKMCEWVVENDFVDSHMCLWMYGLLNVLDKPLPSKTAANMNDLFQWMIQQKKHLLNEKNQTQQTTDQIAHLNTILIIVNKFYHQGDPSYL